MYKKVLSNSSPVFVRAVIVFLLLASFQVSVKAATIESTATGGLWTDGSTWIGGVAPVATDDVIISTTGGNSVTLGAPTTCAALTINFDASLIAGANLLTLTGNFNIIGTFSSTTGGVTFTGTGTQSISGFTTTGNINMTKTGGVATLVGGINAAALIINGPGGTLNLGTGRTHTFTGDIILTAGTLEGGASTLNANSTSATAWSGTGSNFEEGTSTVVLGGAAQTIATTTTFFNLTLGGSGAKTFGAGTTTTIEGTHTIANGTATNVFTGSIVYGASAALRYNVGALNRTVSTEWPTPFLGTGGVEIDGTAPGTITLNGSKVLGNNTNVPLTINSGAVLAAGANGLTFHGDFINNGTLTSTGAITIAGTVPTQNISGFTTTGAVSLTKTGGTANLTSNVGAASLTLNGAGGTLDLGSATHTFTGAVTLTNGTLLGSTATLSFAGNLSGAATFTPNACNIIIAGGATQSILGFTTTGNITVTKNAAATATFTGNVNANSLIMAALNASGQLNLGSGLTHTFTGVLTRTAGILNCGSSTINFTGTGTVITGTGATFTPSTSTVVLAGAAQTVANTIAFNNITFAGNGPKTFASGITATINGIFSIENGTNANVFTGATVTYAGTSSLRYNAGSANRTVGGEWITTFLGTGGVVIGGTGIITLNAAKTLGTNTQAPLTISSGATLATGNFGLTFNGDFVNNGTLTAGSSPIVLTGTLISQNIAGFTTTGMVSMTKTAGTATFTGNVNAGALTTNGNGGTLHLGTALSHTFSGTWTRSNGTLNGGSSVVDFSNTTAFSGTTGTFTAGTGTVIFSGAAQACPVLAFNNLTLSGSGIKTFSTTPTVNGILSLEGTATVVVTTGVVTYGPEATLRFNKTTSYTTTAEEFTSPFVSRGGVIIAGTGAITLNGAKNITYKLNINTGATINLGTGLTHNCKGLIRGPGLVEAGTFGGTTSGATTIDPTYFATATGTIISSSPTATWDITKGSTDWQLNSNWIEGARPDATTDAIIPAGGTQPTLTAAAITKDLTIDPGATVTSAGFQLSINGNLVNNGTLTLSSSPVVIAGTLTQSIAGFTTTGTVSCTKTASVATFAGNISANALTVNGSGGTLNLGTSLTHAVNGNITITAGTLNGGSSSMECSGNISGAGTFTGNAMSLVLSGTSAQAISSSPTPFTTTGSITMTKTGGTATLGVNITAGALTINGAGGTLNLGTSRTHTFSGDITLTNGTLEGGTTTTLNANSSTATAWTGTGGSFSAGTGTVVLGGGAQTINTTTIFNNLTLGGTGVKTFASGTTITINGTHTIANATNVNVFTGATILYGASAGLTYNAGASARTTSNEWPTPFTGTGGITISGTGAISLNGPKVLNDNVPLTISSGATLTPGANLLTLGGNFTRLGTLTSGTGGITIAGTANQSISGGFTTTGPITMTKTGATATFTSGITSAASLTLNGTGGTLALGAFTHVVTGAVTLTNGTLDASSATLNVGGSFTRTSGTLVSTAMNLGLTGTAAQSIMGFTTTGNVIMSKTALSATFTGNVSAGALTINGAGGTLNLGAGLTHTFSGTWTRTNGTLDGGSSTINFSAGGSFISGSGGTFTAGTGTVNYSGAAQTVGDLTYNNLTLSGSGVKTTSMSVTVNKIFSLEGTATVSAPFTYSGDATLRYNKSAPYTTTTNEFPAVFLGLGGVINAGTGIITFDDNKTIIAPLVINNGSQIDLGNFTGHSSKGLTLGGVVQSVGSYGGTTSAATNINATFFATATGQIAVTNPAASWLGLTSDWSDPANWSGNEVPNFSLDVTINSGTPQQPILTSNVETGDLIINAGATLTSAGFQISIYGDYTATGTAILSNSPIVLTGIFNQNIGALTTTGNVSMTKTGGTATFTGNISAGSLILNGTGGTLNLGLARTHTFTGDITQTAGTLVGNTSNIVVAGTAAQSIAGLTTTGAISSTKTGGTAAFTGNINAASITVNGTGGTLNLGAGLTHTISGNTAVTLGTLNGGSSTLILSGSLTNAATLTGNAMNLTMAGTGAQNIAGFTTTGTITSTKTASTATFTGNISAGAITVNGTGGTVSLGAGLTHTVSGNVAVTLGTLNGATSTLVLSGNLTAAGTLTGTSMNLTLTGTAAQSIIGFTTLGNVLMAKTAGTATLAGNISVAGLTLNGLGGTLDFGPARTHTFTGNIVVANGTLNANTSNIVLAGTTAQSVAGFTTTGTVSMTKTAGAIATFTGSVNAGGLTLNGLGGTLHLGNALNHTFSGTWTRTNGTLDGGTSTINFTAPGTFISGSVGSFVPNAGTVNYSNPGAQTVGQFTYYNLTLSGGGVKTTTSVTVTEVFSLEGTATVSAPITYGSSATLQYNKPSSYTTTTNEFPATFAGSGGVNILGAGTIIFDAAKTISATLTINSGSTVDLNGITGHVCNGLVFDIALQSAVGTYGRTGSGATNINDVFFAAASSGTILLNVSTTNWIGTTFDWTDPLNWSSGVPTSISDVVIPSGVPNQPIITSNAECRDLTINTSASVTASAVQITLYGNFINNGTANLGSSPLIITGTANQTINPFTTTGNVSVTKLGGTATVTNNLSIGGLTINGAGGTLNLGSGFTHTISGDIIVSAGTLIVNNSNIVLTGTAVQNIAGFTTTGIVNSTKTGGTATLTGNLNAAALTINGVGGTVDLGSSLTHTIPGDITLTNGTLDGGSSTLNLGGNISGAGTFAGNASNITLTGSSTQNIVGFTTTGNINIIKTGGTATFGGNVNAGALTLNGSGSILDLGTGRTHTFTGDITLTDGTLIGGNNTINVNASSTTAWTGTGSNFDAGTSTVVFGGGAQTINTSTIFNNLTLAGSDVKTFANGTIITINAIHQIANGANMNDFTGATIVYGSGATIRYNAGTASRTVSAEWPATFTSTGGVIIDGTGPGVITLNEAKQLGNNTNVVLTINAGATLATNNFGLTFHGNFVNNGTFTAGSSAITLAGTTATQSIPAITTTGNITTTKTSGTATFGGNINAAGLIVNGSGSTLSLGTGRTHTFTGDIVLTAGTLTAGNNTLNVNSPTATAWSGTGSNFSAGTSTVIFGGANQTIATPTIFNNLTINGTGTAVMPNTLTIGGNLVTNQAIDFTTNTNTTTLNGGSAQTISGSSRPSFHALTINNAAGVSMGVRTTVNNTLTLTAGTFNLNTDSLTLGGTINRTSGNINAQNGKVRMAGSGAQVIPANVFVSNTVKDLTIANPAGVTLGGAVLLTNVLTPESGTLASGSNLTLVSTASTTASIANGNCNSCSYITGNVSVQRNVPASARRWRFAGSPVTSATLADWKNEVYITGTGGAANGFDATLSNQASVYSYDESLITGNLNTGWVAATNITNPLVVGKGYRLFIRGDRSDAGRLTGSNTTQNAVTMDLVGTPNQGDIIMPVTYTSSGIDADDGWNLLANPYAAPYDWNAHFDNGTFHNNLDPTIWILSAQTGGYVSYNASSNAGTLTNGIIPSGASFWVKATGSSPSLTFKEQFKVTTTPVSLFKTNEGEAFSIRIMLDSITSDELLIKYADQSTPDYDTYDIRKLAGMVNISAYGKDNIQLSLSTRPITTEVDTIKLNVSGTEGNYKMSFANNQEIAVQDNVFLIDNYLSTVTDLKVSSEYTFSILAGTAESQGQNRFYIVVGNNKELPVKLLTFAAHKEGTRSVRLNWSTAQEINNEKFVVERSEDGKQFAAIATVRGNGVTQRVINYSFIDEQPKGINYYRLKQVDFDGTASYSKTVRMDFNTTETTVNIYPMPVMTTLFIENKSKVAFVSYSLSDMNGQILQTSTLQDSAIYINMGNFETGVYILQLIDESGLVTTEKIIKQ